MIDESHASGALWANRPRGTPVQSVMIRDGMIGTFGKALGAPAAVLLQASKESVIMLRQKPAYLNMARYIASTGRAGPAERCRCRTNWVCLRAN